MIIKSIMRHMSAGLLLGSFVYLLFLLIRMKPVVMTPKDIITTLIISALIGILSMIFDSERLNYWVALVIHYLGVILIVGLSTNITVILGSPVVFVIEITVMYIIVWLMLHIATVLNIRSINNELKRKKQNKKRD
ncbi:DUF3021 family protein [Dellaglioa sp. BT-FLS60]